MQTTKAYLPYYFFIHIQTINNTLVQYTANIQKTPYKANYTPNKRQDTHTDNTQYIMSMRIGMNIIKQDKETPTNLSHTRHLNTTKAKEINDIRKIAQRANMGGYSKALSIIIETYYRNKNNNTTQEYINEIKKHFINNF